RRADRAAAARSGQLPALRRALPPRGLAVLLLGCDRAVRRDLDALRRELLAHEELERRPGAPPRLEHAVDLPLGEHARIRAARLRPVGELRQAATADREVDALLDRTRQPFLSYGHVEARLAQRVRERAER